MAEPATPTAHAPTPQQGAVRPGPDTPASPSVFSPTRNSEADRSINDSSDEEFSKQFGLEDMMSPPEPAAKEPAAKETAAAKRDREGNLHGPDGKYLPKDAAAAAGAEEVPESPPAPRPVETPAAEVPAQAPAEVPAVEPAKPEKPAYQLATEFRVADEAGELDVADTASRLKLTFKANGAEQKDVPLDKVVRLAQRGVYNEAQQQEVQTARLTVAQAQQEMQQAKALLAENQQWFEQALADAEQLLAAVPPEKQSGFLGRALRSYAQQNSPEARLERERSALREQQQTFQQQQETTQVQQFNQTQLAPAIEGAVQAHPSVSFEEAFGRFNILLMPFLVNGRVPVARLPEVLTKVQDELVPWIESTHQSRTAKEQTQHRQQQAAATTAQTQATLAKRQLARAVAPSPAQAPALREPPKKRTFKSAQQATDEFDPTVEVAGA